MRSLHGFGLAVALLVSCSISNVWGDIIDVTVTRVGLTKATLQVSGLDVPDDTFVHL
jgi:hypothetical protein